MKKDIESRTDIEYLVKTFYEQVLSDEVIGFIFTEVVPLDFSEHIPVIVDFWASVLFQQSSYKGNVMHKHIDLDKKVRLLPEHFERWEQLFVGVAQQHFEGPNTSELIRRVGLIKPMMQFKVEQSRGYGFIQ